MNPSRVLVSYQFWLRVLLLALFLVYVIAAILEYQLLSTVLFQVGSASLFLSTVVRLPYEVLLNTSLFLSTLFFINIFLTAWYLVLLHTLHQGLGASRGVLGFLGTLLGVGCVACGSLLTPVILAVGVVAPSTLLLQANVVVSLLTTVALVVAIKTRLENGLRLFR